MIKGRPIRVARTMRGSCHICFKMVMPGEAYEYTGSSNTHPEELVHFNCHKPDGAPTFEELMARGQDVRK